MIVNLCLFITVTEISPQFRENGKNPIFLSFPLKQSVLNVGVFFSGWQNTFSEVRHSVCGW